VSYKLPSGEKMEIDVLSVLVLYTPDQAGFYEVKYSGRSAFFKEESAFAQRAPFFFFSGAV